MVNICTSENCGNFQHDLQMLQNKRLKSYKNRLVGCLYTNSLRNKIIDLREMIQYLNLNYFIVNDTKIDLSFPSAQFTIENYEIEIRRDRNCNGED